MMQNPQESLSTKKKFIQRRTPTYHRFFRKTVQCHPHCFNGLHLFVLFTKLNIQVHLSNWKIKCTGIHLTPIKAIIYGLLSWQMEGRWKFKHDLIIEDQFSILSSYETQISNMITVGKQHY